MEIEFELREL